MFTESFHNILKMVYLDNKHNRRLDHFIYILLKIECDKGLGQFQKMHKGKSTHRVTEINKRHRTAEKMTTTVKQLQQDLWSIESEKQAGMGYTVRQISDCFTCRLRCSNCSACIHMYTCTCLDSITHTTVCKHIHFIHMQAQRQTRRERQFSGLKQGWYAWEMGHPVFYIYFRQ